jgi:hypothetical protein
MSKKIVIVHDGPDEDVFPLLSLIIGLRKTHPGCFVIWAGHPSSLPLVRYNKRIKRILDITREFGLKTLEQVFETDICVNASFTHAAKDFASNVRAENTFGFTKQGPTSRKAEFFENVVSGKITTNKTLLQMYYDLVDLRWRGEGYGLTYYPRVKQTEKCGFHLVDSETDPEDCTKIRMPKDLLKRLDTINKYAEIVTDDLFTAHASIALRKQCTLTLSLPYRMEFFGRGQTKNSDQ